MKKIIAAYNYIMQTNLLKYIAYPPNGFIHIYINNFAKIESYYKPCMTLLSYFDNMP